MTKRYELLYLVPTSIGEDDLPKTTGQIAELITSLGGKIEKNDLWARRKLTYPIKRQPHAYYCLAVYEAAGDLNAKLDRELRLKSEIIRFVITEPVPPPVARKAPVEETAPKPEKPALPSIRKTAAPKKEKAEKVSLEELDRKLDEILDDNMQSDK